MAVENTLEGVGVGIVVDVAAAEKLDKMSSHIWKHSDDKITDNQGSTISYRNSTSTRKACMIYMNTPGQRTPASSECPQL